MIICTFGGLIGCNDEIVARGVDQKQANEIVSIFSQSKISSKVKKDPNSKKLLVVSVDKSDYENAVSILTSKDLPKDKGTTFSEVISHHGILPDSKRMEDLRLDKALSLEIEENISKIQQFSSVSVVVRKEYLPKGSSPLVSVLLIEKPNYKSKLSKDDIIKIIKTAVPEVDSSNISIVKERENHSAIGTGIYGSLKNEVLELTKFLGQFNVAKQDYTRLVILFFSTILISALIGGFLVSLYFRLKNIKKEKSKIVEITSKDLLGKNITKGMARK